MPDTTTTTTNVEDEKMSTTFATEVDAAFMLQTPRGGRLILYIIILLVSAALVWSWYAEIDDVIKSQGKIIPSSHVQEIQNLEGGILKEILVQEGQAVIKGQPLLLLENVQFSAELQKNKLKAAGMEVAMQRLSAEATGKEVDFPKEMAATYPEIVAIQLRLAKSRQENLESKINVLELEREQKEKVLAQLEQKLRSAQTKLTLEKEELAKLKPLINTGAVSEMEILQARQRLAEAQAEKDNATLAIPETRSAIKQADEQIRETAIDFREQADQEYNKILVEYRSLVAFQKSVEDKVNRTSILSPVHGTVKKIYIDTIGGTIRPGMTMMEIVPLDDTLLVETKVVPKDIGFIRQGQKAKVKLSAYDFAVYGGLEGTVERVSADSITDDKGRTFFIIVVSIPQNYVGQEEDNLLIIPGMQAEVDVVVTRRKLIDYILRPLLKAKYE